MLSCRHDTLANVLPHDTGQDELGEEKHIGPAIKLCCLEAETAQVYHVEIKRAI